MKKSLYFTGRSEVEIKEEPVRSPREGEVLIESILSSISFGSEKLVYKGRLTDDNELDTAIDSLDKKVDYPIKYGYSSLGEVVSVGKGVSDDIIGRDVFCFHPHESKFLEKQENIILVPEEIDLRDFSFLPSVETAVNFALDGGPMIGEKVAVIGQGVVGLMTTAVLENFPLDKLITVDPISGRRKASEELGADIIYEDIEDMNSSMTSQDGLDLAYELSGDPSTLEKVFDSLRYDGRIVIGSWYGDKENSISLGTHFHRNRISIKSSQVSSIDPDISGRWDKDRRMDQVIKMIKKIEPKDVISHEIPFTEAEKAYELLDKKPEKCIQVILRYD